MITWMQRHKKYLIVTIWISTIAFVGAGFVGWGQYSYGDKAGAVAKVGSIEITMGQLNKEYSRLYAQYNQMLQGNLDKEKAKGYGLEKQALQRIVERTLILNLAKSYDLTISKIEIAQMLNKTDIFNKDRNIYFTNVKQQGYQSVSEFEKEIEKNLLVQKTLSILKVTSNKNESNILNTLYNIADKINYKILDTDNLEVDTSDTLVKTFWETRKENFLTDTSYDVKYIKQLKANNTFDEETIKEYYTQNKNKFKNEIGKILKYEEAKDAVVSKLNTKATKKLALRLYIAYKKGKISKDINIQTATISVSKNPFNNIALEKIAGLTLTSPYLKPIEINGDYYIFELLKKVSAKTKTFEEAKELVLPNYIIQTKKAQLIKLAKKSAQTFTGKTTDFIARTDIQSISDLTPVEASEFLSKLFLKDKKRGYITLTNGKIILFNIMEQKLLSTTNNKDNSILNIKNAIFIEGLLKNLQNKYKTEKFMKGL